MDSFYFVKSDRINRMNWIFSRFPDEPANIASAYRRENSDDPSEFGDVLAKR
jgi:hypothetical protein